MFEFKLPDVGDGITEGTLVKWRVKEGDTIKEDDIVADVETDKAVVEISAPISGKVEKLPHKEGDVIEVHSLFMWIDDGSGGSAPKEEKKEKKDDKKESKPAEKKESAPAATQAQAAPISQTRSGEIIAMPKVRKLAREKGVDLSNIVGSGPNGRILEADLEGGSVAVVEIDYSEIIATPTVRKYAREKGIDLRNIHGSGLHGQIVKEDVDGTSHAAPLPAKRELRKRPSEKESRVAMTPIRKIIAKKMTESLQTAPQVTQCEEIDVSKLVELRSKQKEEMKAKGIKLTYLPYITKALIRALINHPYFNASLDGDEIVLKNYFNIGYATGTDAGLLVPNIKDADKLSIEQLAKELEILTKKGRDKKLSLEEMQQGTFTISNVGNLAGQMFTPILNYPEVGILGVGKIMKKPIVKNEGIAIADMMFISLSYDHRVVDGDEAARFLTELKENLEDPSLLEE